MTEFPTVSIFSKGYDRAQVDAFFEDARTRVGFRPSSSVPSRCAWRRLSSRAGATASTLLTVR